MDLFACDCAVPWTGGIKALLDNKQKEQVQACREESEPTSVLDVSDRFSPPLVTACSFHTDTHDVSRHEDCIFTQLLADAHFQPRLLDYTADYNMPHDDEQSSWVTTPLPHTASCSGLHNSASSSCVHYDCYAHEATDVDAFFIATTNQLTQAPMMGSSDIEDQNELVSMYINHTEDNMTCSEAEPTTSVDRYKVLVHCQSSARRAPFAIAPDEELSRSLPVVYHEDHTVHADSLFIEIDDIDDSCSVDNLANHPPNLHPFEKSEKSPFEDGSTLTQSHHNSIQDSGLQLVHLLLACAEAVAWRDLPLAAALLDQLHLFASYTGDAIQRVTYCFAEGLSERLAIMSKEASHMQFLTISHKREGLLQLYHCSPYIPFGFFAANQAILQAFENKTHVHILDLGMMQNLQWPGLIRALATRAEGPPEVRISVFGGGMESLAEMTEWGRELRDFASSLKVQLEFKVIGEVLDTSKLSIEALDLREVETLAINSVLQLHKVVKESRGSLKGVLQRLQRLGAGVMTLIEQDASHNGPFFLGRFLESLHYYSAVFDSLEASLGRHSQERMKVERLHYAEQIRNIVACEGLDRIERHERGDQWRRQMSRAGFQVVPLKFISQARMLLSLYSCDGYTLCDDKGCLVLGWKSKPIMLASAWRVLKVDLNFEAA